jgi:hypothetical protein
MFLTNMYDIMYHKILTKLPHSTGCYQGNL